MRRLIVFFAKYHLLFIFLLLEGVAFWLVKESTYYQGAKITTATNQVTGYIHGKIYSISNYFHLKSENERLAMENVRLKNENIILHDKLSVISISSLLGKFSLPDTTYQYINGSVVYNSFSKRDNYLMLNVGAEDGIMPDMGVVASDGIIGTVIDVSKRFCLVMSVLHKDNKVSVKILKNNTIGSLIWEGGSYKTAMMVDIPSHVDVKPGDTIVTSGYSGGFPANAIVGIVKRIKQDKGVGLEVEINLSLDMNKINHVYVVKDCAKDEKDKLLNPEDEEGTPKTN